jgi:PAS domain S-box-containing protein
LYNASVYKDEAGKIIGVFAAARDITELKRAEEKIQTLANAVESSNDAIITKSLDEIINTWNKGAEQVYGYSAEEVLGKTISIIEPENLKGETKRLTKKIKQGERIHHYETLRLKKDGTIINVSITLSPVFDESGKLVAISTIARDITERKKAEETLRLSNLYNRSLIEASLDPLVTIGPDGKITDVNKATELVTGYSRSKLIGTDFIDYFTEPEKAKKGYQQVFKEGSVFDYELEIQNRNGSKTPVLYNASLYKGESGKVIGVFAAARDISKNKKAEEALKKAYDNLEKLVEERTTELEKAYKSLKESEEGLSEAQKIAHIGNWEWEIATGKVYWSDELYRIFGRNPQELAPISDELFNYIHPDDRDFVDNAIKEALKEKPYGGIDYRIILANGEERTVHAKSEVIFDEENTPIRVKGIIQDITGRKKTEEKIQTLANAVESSSDAIVTQSLDNIITSWNKAAEQIYGYSAEEIIGKNASMLEPENIKGEIKYLSEKIRQGKNVQHYETLRLKKDGSLINISVTLSPVFNVSGELVALSAIVRDITERKREEKALRESEARLRRFYESGMFGVIYYNVDGSITDANNKFLEIVGYSREDMQTGKVNWKKMTPPEYRLLDEGAVAELKAAGENVAREKEYIRKDGSRVPIILGAATLDPESQEGIAFVIDNTERKKAEEALAEMDKMRIKEIHHRIKNNLQVISSLLDLQADKFGDEKVRDAFKESQNRVVSMSLIHEELYKGEGTDKLNFSAYLQKLAENLFQTYSLSNKNIRLLTDLEEDAFFDMDTAVPLGIIVNELVSNSLKHAFTEGEEGEVRIRLCREEKKNGIRESPFSLTISDNGKGIPENIELESLESLGLQLVSILVDQLDGKIEVKRAQGAEFKITFNVAEKL